MTLIKTNNYNSPSCPYAFPGRNDRHLFFNQIKDRLYHHLEKNTEGEIVNNEAGKLYNKLDEMYDYHMRLYQAEATAINSYREVLFTYWWQCPICDFVLPATGVKSR